MAKDNLSWRKMVSSSQSVACFTENNLLFMLIIDCCPIDAKRCCLLCNLKWLCKNEVSGLWLQREGMNWMDCFIFVVGKG